MDNTRKAVKARAYKALTGGLLMLGAATAWAQESSEEGISSWMQNIGAETAIIVDILVVVFGAVGIALAGFGIISAVMAKKNREPMQHQPWFIVGGVLAILLVPFIAALGTSVSGEEQDQDDVSEFLDSQ